jgi:peptidoglycan-associated lipoprotein
MPRRQPFVSARSAPIALIALPFVWACSHKPPPPPVAAVPPPAPAAEPKPAEPTPVSPNLAVAEDLGKQCSLHFRDAMQAPKFDYDQFQLLPEDRDVLEQVATCITSGPLRGRKVALVGRADPRGTDEYNLALGDKRARTVVDYLHHLGVANTQIAVSTRGALDARGTDDSSWRIDRRVDLELRN